MSERRPAAPPDSAEATELPWDPDKIRDALGTPDGAQSFALPSPTTATEEIGIGLVLGDPPAAILELYPSQQRLLLRTPGVRVELDGVEAPTIGPEGVIFERTSPAHALWLSLGRNGEFALQSTPVAPIGTEGPQIATRTVDVIDRPIDGSDPELPAPGHSAAPDDPSDMSSPTPQREGNAEKQERVKVFGRLATQVRFKTRQSGQLIGEFVLAERLDEEQTAFHKVAAFDNPRTNRLIATKLKAQVDAGEIGKGKPATVVGYRHASERRKRDGSTTTETQIYAVAISAR